MTKEHLIQPDAQLLRLKAEYTLKMKEHNGQSKEPETELDVKKLLHELQVHKIELEMQNEELRDAYEATEVALSRYTMLYDLSPMSYFTLNPEGVIIELNFAGAEILDDRRFSLVNSNFKLYVDEESKPVFNEFFRKIFATNSNQSCKVKLGYDDNPLCHVYMEGIAVSDKTKCLLSVINVSNFQ